MSAADKNSFVYEQNHLRTKCVLWFSACFAFVVLLGTLGCNPSEAAQQSKQDTKGETESSLIDFKWSVDADCEACHIKESESKHASDRLVSQHDSVVCITCHSDQSSLSEVHKEVSSIKDPKKGKLWNTTIAEATCTACHGSWEELAAITKDDTTLTDAQKTSINPHEIPASDNHDEISCVNCHVMHINDPSVIRRQCISCHHAEVWECGTCHTYVKEDE